jgi:hypothetical protein
MYRHVYCATTVNAELAYSAQESVVWSQRLDLLRLQGKTAEYKPRPTTRLHRR